MRYLIGSFLLVCLSFGLQAQVVVTPQGYATTQGVAVMPMPMPISPALVAAPVMRLSTPTPPVGAMAAAPGQQIGATSTPSAVVVAPEVPSIVPVFTGTAPLAIVNPWELAGGVQPEAESSATQQQPSASPAQNHFDFGAAPISEIGGIAGGRSVADVAASYQRGRQGNVAHTYTNQDIDTMNQKAGASGAGGIGGAAAEAGAESTQPGEPAGVVAAPPSQSQNTTKRTVDHAAPPPQRTMETTPAPRSPKQSGQQPTRPNAQPEPPPSPPETASAASAALPAASSLLPLIAVLGFVAASAGLLSRR